MKAESASTDTHGVFRFAIWALIGGAVSIVLAKVSIVAADSFADGPFRTTLQFGTIVSLAVGLILLDRGYRTKNIQITPLYITGLLGFLLILVYAYLRMFLFAAAVRGQLDL